nr:helix-turn-helix domain-containing protein [Sodalis glossinidius]
MSVPAFHKRFKAVTGTSPLQYIKSLRLNQVRLLMIRNSLSATSAAFKVGMKARRNSIANFGVFSAAVRRKKRGK